jgi:hypothetical protein
VLAVWMERAEDEAPEGDAAAAALHQGAESRAGAATPGDR